MTIAVGRLWEISSEARDEFERCSVDRALLAKLYGQYNGAVGDVPGFVQEAAKLFPALNCGLCSVYLHHVVGYGSVRTGSYAGQGHTFLMLDDVIVDITADQFSGPPVCVGPMVQPWSLEP